MLFTLATTVYFFASDIHEPPNSSLFSYDLRAPVLYGHVDWLALAKTFDFENNLATKALLSALVMAHGTCHVGLARASEGGYPR